MLTAIYHPAALCYRVHLPSGHIVNIGGVAFWDTLDDLRASLALEGLRLGRKGKIEAAA